MKTDKDCKFIATIVESLKDSTCTRFRLKAEPLSFDTNRHLDIQHISLYISSKEISVVFSNGYIRIDLDTLESDVAGNTFTDTIEVSKLLNIIETKILLANIKEENK
jgi:hypothetical protein|nr:MAG TPA: hypothetical protein [Caudoviricetes sp.]DAP91028.1 MAG TPA: hypothetical protein [Caudoviricetes sp.]